MNLCKKVKAKFNFKSAMYYDNSWRLLVTEAWLWKWIDFWLWFKFIEHLGRCRHILKKYSIDLGEKWWNLQFGVALQTSRLKKKCHVLLARKKFGKGKSATAYLGPSENGLSAGHPPIPTGADWMGLTERKLLFTDCSIVAHSQNERCRLSL